MLIDRRPVSTVLCTKAAADRAGHAQCGRAICSLGISPVLRAGSGSLTQLSVEVFDHYSADARAVLSCRGWTRLNFQFCAVPGILGFAAYGGVAVVRFVLRGNDPVRTRDHRRLLPREQRIRAAVPTLVN